jgi:hypothetical protein
MMYIHQLIDQIVYNAKKLREMEDGEVSASVLERQLLRVEDSCYSLRERLSLHVGD